MEAGKSKYYQVFGAVGGIKASPCSPLQWEKARKESGCHSNDCAALDPSQRGAFTMMVSPACDFGLGPLPGLGRGRPVRRLQAA